MTAAAGDADDAAQHVVEGSAGVEQHFIKAELGEMTELESMCPACQDNGRTRLMITKIPHFREVIVSSFECPHCGESNREVQFGGEYGPKRVQFKLDVRRDRDMNRQLVKSDYATLTIPELELELGPDAQRGTLNTIEGVLQQVEDGLQFQQAARKLVDEDTYTKIEAFCAKMRDLRDGPKPFTVFLDDPSGNSYIEGIFDAGMGHVDPQLVRFEVTRSEAERRLIGLAGDGDYNTHRSEEEERAVERGVENQITEFAQDCPACAVNGTVKIHETTIPHFGRIVIMAFKCESCGYKSNDIKNAAEIPSMGLKINLRVENEADMVRDVLKSDSTRLCIPEIDLELSPGTLGGFFTTVEGLLSQVYDNLAGLRQTSFESGDSAAAGEPTRATSMKSFLDQLAELRDGRKFPFTLELQDPLGMIYVQNPRSHLEPPHNADPQLTVEQYERTEEEKDELGLL